MLFTPWKPAISQSECDTNASVPRPFLSLHNVKMPLSKQTQMLSGWMSQVVESTWCSLFVSLWSTALARVNHLARRLFPDPYSGFLEPRQSRPQGEPDYGSSNIWGMDYRPRVQAVLHHSTNAIVARLEIGVVIKHSRYAWWEHPESERCKQAKLAFEVETQILEVLESHPRIVPFLGTFEPQGLRFAEAEFGSLQSFIDQHFESITPEEKMRWRFQAAEAIAYIHEKCVIHSDLRPDNFLLYAAPAHSKSIRLCDFGGSVYKSLNGGNLPDAGFFDPRKPWVSTEQTDIFSLGSVFYTIMEGHWPHRARGQLTADEYDRYAQEVDMLFSNDQFPAVGHIEGGTIIQGCWNDQYERAEDVLLHHRMLWQAS